MLQVKRVVMERDTYPRRWGLGPTASKKKRLAIEEKAAAGTKDGTKDGKDGSAAKTGAAAAAPVVNGHAEGNGA
jgi:H/ACA ribonucleoprotein complex subunit 4